MGWLSGWSWAKEISLTGQTGAGTLYQVDLDIGDSAGGDFHLEGNCTNFPQDIEVTDNDGTTILDFSIEDITADPLKMWVEVADDLGSNQKIWVYYGKSGATTNSDIGATFLLGDDFSGDLSKWTIELAGYASIESGRLKLIDSGSSNPTIRSNNTYGALNIALDFKIQHTPYPTFDGENYGGMTDVSVWGWGGGDWVLPFRLSRNQNYYTNTVLNGSSTQTLSGVSQTSAESLRTVALYSGHAKHYFNGGSEQDDTTNIPNSPMYVKFSHHLVSGSDYPTYIDDVRVRKYNDPEPAFASAGAEQSAPGVGHPTMRRWGGIPGMQYTGRGSW